MRVFLTIDVDVYYTGDYALEARGHGLGVDFLVEACTSRGLPSTYFVDAMGATRWGQQQVSELCAFIQERGQEVQLHLHPHVAEIDGFHDEFDTLWRHDLDTQCMLLERGVEILNAGGVKTVTAFRAGALAANADTLTAMKRCGMQIGANRDLDLKSSLESQLNDVFPVQNDASAAMDTVDLPVNCVRSPIPQLDGPFRHLEICAMSAAELIDALVRLRAAGVQNITILTHPKEFFYMLQGRAVPNRKNRARLQKVLSHLASDPGYEVLPISAAPAPGACPTVSPPIPRGSLPLALTRVLAQGLHRIRMRPAIARAQRSA